MGNITMNIMDEDMLRRIVKYIISRDNVSITDLSTRSGVSRQIIYNWLNGKRSITYDNLVRISRILD